MVLSQYLFKPFYTAIWRLLNKIKADLPVAFYCPEIIDYHTIAPVLKHLHEVRIISGSSSVSDYLKKNGIAFHKMPCFPSVIIMCRHATHKFPCSDIFKIGFRHGAYHFKRMTKAANYNQFDLYFFSSTADLKAAQKLGVNCGVAVGFPRLDSAFDGSVSTEYLQKLRSKLGFDKKTKPVLLFSSTWDESGMSAAERWIGNIDQYADKYNILVTLHPWLRKKYSMLLSQTRGIYLIDEVEELIPYIMLADVCIGDTSSIMAEFCALNKPIISFRTKTARRSLPEIEALLDTFTHRISEFEDLLPAIEACLQNPNLLESERQQANMLMFDSLDGRAGYRAAEIIKKNLKSR